VIADAVFLRAEERAAIAAAGEPFTGLWLEAPLEVLRARVAARRGDASDATPAVVEAAAARDPGCITWHRLDASTDAETGARKVLDLPVPPSP
jgi:predicted kinase